MKQQLVSALGLAFVIGCSMVASGQRATAELKDKDGKTVGSASLREEPDGVLVRLEVKGLAPGLHAVQSAGKHKTLPAETASFFRLGSKFYAGGEEFFDNASISLLSKETGNAFGYFRADLAHFHQFFLARSFDFP